MVSLGTLFCFTSKFSTNLNFSGLWKNTIGNAILQNLVKRKKKSPKNTSFVTIDDIGGMKVAAQVDKSLLQQPQSLLKTFRETLYREVLRDENHPVRLKSYN